MLTRCHLGGIRALGGDEGCYAQTSFSVRHNQPGHRQLAGRSVFLDLMTGNEPGLGRQECEALNNPARILIFSVQFAREFGLAVRTVIVSTALVGTLVLAGCAAPTVGPNARYGATAASPTVKGIWLRKDGRSGKDDPVMARQFQLDKASCNAGTTVDTPCMAQRGYLLVPESEVEVRALELRAAARSAPPS